MSENTAKPHGSIYNSRNSDEPGGLPQVAGRRIATSNEVFERSALVCLMEHQAKGEFTDNALVSVLCEAVRLCREYTDHAGAAETKELIDGLRAELATALADKEAALNSFHAANKERLELQQENERLQSCLQPGTAPAIMNGLFREAERLGFYTPTGKHALTQFVEEIERCRSELSELRKDKERLNELWPLLREYMEAEPSSVDVKHAWDKLEAWWKQKGSENPCATPSSGIGVLT